jgi:hypothetical protein
MKPTTIIAYGITGAAVLLTAWKGTLDWMGLMAVALIFKMPGWRTLKNMLSKRNDSK